MSKLREQIDNIVALAYYEGSDSRPLLPDWTDRILAHIADAMLSEEAVEASTRAGFHASVNAVWGDNADLDIKSRDIVALSHRAGLTAAIAAAGITGAGQEGGEGNEDDTQC